MVHWWILGACLSDQPRKPQRMLIMDIRRNADRLTLIYTAILSRFGVCAGLRRCMQAQSHPEHAAAKRGHHRFLFVCFLSEKKGVRRHPPNPPWLRAWNRFCLSQLIKKVKFSNHCTLCREEECCCQLHGCVPVTIRGSSRHLFASMIFVWRFNALMDPWQKKIGNNSELKLCLLCVCVYAFDLSEVRHRV